MLLGNDGPALVLPAPQDRAFVHHHLPSSSYQPVNNRGDDDAAAAAANLSKKRSCHDAELDYGHDNNDDAAAFSSRKTKRLPSDNNSNKTSPTTITTTQNPHSSSSFIDDATQLLGISWQRVDNDDDMTPAYRGWKKYIDNRFSLYDSQFLLKSRALDMYLIAARPNSSSSSSCVSFYLFSEDLSQARLVASSWEKTVQNLSSVPIVFEGGIDHVLVAADRHHHQQHQQHHHHEFNGCGGTGMNEGMGMGGAMDVDS